MSVQQIAAVHYRRQTALARRAAEQVLRLWRRIDRQQIAQSWRQSLPAVLGVVGSAQMIAAASAGVYVEDVLEEQGQLAEVVGRVRPDAFAGVASDGRDLADLLYLPAVKTLTLIRDGVDVRRAMSGGLLELDMMVRTQVADAGRVADGVAITARPKVAGYVRMLSLPSCSRCVVLAGRFYRWSQGFSRHPRCDCRHIPSSEDVAGDLRTDPKGYFDGLSADQQERVFTKDGAQAIRDGGDIAQVVNARRGMYLAAGRRLTREGGKGRRARLMPEQVYREADGDRAEAIRLLKLHGYLI